MKYHWKQGFPVDESAASLWMEVTPGCGAWNWHYGILKIALQSSSSKDALVESVTTFLADGPKEARRLLRVSHLHILIFN